MSRKIMIGNDLLLNKEFREKMKAAGVLPEDCTGIKIVIPAGEACKVYAYRQEDGTVIKGCGITGHEIFQSEDIRQKMIDAGISLDGCTRIIIDIPCNGLFQVYTETPLKEEDIGVVCDIAVKIAAEEKENEGG